MFSKKLILFILSPLLLVFNPTFATDSRAELEKMIGLSFYQSPSSQEEMYLVEWKNEQGEAIGRALFQNPLMPKGFESVLWFYDCNEGYSVIVRESDLNQEAGIQIDKIFINGNGTVVALYKNNQTATWLSWSKDEGLFLDSELNLRILYHLNEKDFFLFQKKEGNFGIINAKNPSENFTVAPLDLNLDIIAPIDLAIKKGYSNTYYDKFYENYFLDHEFNIIAKITGEVVYQYKAPNCPPCNNCWQYLKYNFEINFIKKLNMGWQRINLKI